MTTFKKDPTASPRTAQPTMRIPSTGDLALTPARHSGQRYLCLHRRLRTVASARGACCGTRREPGDRAADFANVADAPGSRHLIAAGFPLGTAPSGVCADASANRAKVEGVSAEIDQEKKASARAAAAMVEAGMLLGLGTGTTVAFLVPALGERHLDVTSVATSPATESAASEAGLKVVAFEGIDRLDLAIDGSDQVDPEGWLVKGGGGAHTREKIVAAAAARFIVIVSAEKVVKELRVPVPLEILSFGCERTLQSLGSAHLREAPISPDGGLIADYLGPIDDPRSLAARLAGTPGVVEHGLFEPNLVSLVLIGEQGAVRVRQGSKT